MPKYKVKVIMRQYFESWVDVEALSESEAIAEALAGASEIDEDDFEYYDCNYAAGGVELVEEE